jgi:FAD dependent oxidoreductase
MKHRLTIVTILLLAPLSALLGDEIKTVERSDVIVYGSTPGGFCAAIAAAREGASVILLEPTLHVGGVSTGGLSHCDSNQMRRETLMGLFDEWHTRIVKDYTDRGLPAPYDPTLKNQALWTFEPHVAMRVTKAMLTEAGVVVHTGRYLKSVTKEGPRITSLVTKDGTFAAKVFVDGTYEGDLMAAAGVDWTIGREGRDEFDESYAGKRYPKEKMNISGFDDAGHLLPLVTTSDAGFDEAGDKYIMTYSFRLCLTRDPKQLVPMPAPANYNPSRFELARRAFKAGVLKIGLDLYPLPGGKLDGNNSIGGQISLGLVGGCNTWHSADEAGRAKIWEEHKQYTLELLHFLRTDSSVPAQVRDKFATLGLCKDEFAETAHFSPALYVRESRRMRGIYVLSQQDIIDSPHKEDPIAISSFPIDSHDCQRVALKDRGVINEGTIFPVRVPDTGVGYAYHVPYRSVLPQAAQCNNLLVPIALSSTHVAISSLRIEGAWMVIGQGSGVAAALAAKQNVAVQDLQYPVLRERLLAQGQVLKLPPPPAKKAAAKATNLVPVK